MDEAFCCPVPFTKHPETIGGINEKTISICTDSNQEKFPLIHAPDSSKSFWYHKRGTKKEKVK